MRALVWLCAAIAAQRMTSPLLVLLCSCCACASPQIGHHFSKHGRVMDVVMVKDFGPLLNLAATATNLEQQRKEEATKVLTGKKAGGHMSVQTKLRQAYLASTRRLFVKSVWPVPPGLSSSSVPASAALHSQALGSHLTPWEVGAELTAACAGVAACACSQTEQEDKENREKDGCLHGTGQPEAGGVRVWPQGRVCHI